MSWVSRGLSVHQFIGESQQGIRLKTTAAGRVATKDWNCHRRLVKMDIFLFPSLSVSPISMVICPPVACHNLQDDFGDAPTWMPDGSAWSSPSTAAFLPHTHTEGSGVGREREGAHPTRLYQRLVAQQRRPKLTPTPPNHTSSASPP